MEKGYIRLSRSFFDNDIWKTARAFSSCEAWLDLIQSARFEATPTSSCIVGCRVTWGRGQYPASVRFLSKRWGRSERWVRSVLNRFRNEGMIDTDSSQGVTIITLKNYDKYNPTEEATVASDTANDTANDTPNALKNSMLSETTTHQATQQTTHPEENAENASEKRHTPDTKTKKGEEYNIYSRRLTSTTPLKKDSSIEESQKEPLDYDALVALFNATFASTPIAQVRKLTDTRRRSVRARVEEYGLESVSEAFRSVLDSPFLLGQNKRGWVASFDWIFRKSNYIKILERQYAERKNGIQNRRDSVSRLEQLAEAILNDTSTKGIY